jgi:hypothetical protein
MGECLKLNNLFSFIADFDGGTFISQHRKENLNAALLSWAKNSGFCASAELTRNDLSNLLTQINDTDKQPIAISEMENVWCSSYLVGGRLLVVHIVHTVEST